MTSIDAIFNTPEPTPAPTFDQAALDRASKRAQSGTTGSHKAHAVADAQGIIREWKDVYSLTATECACCGQSLRDAVSVTRGIGPVCSRKHYDLEFDITDDMVADALGYLLASGLDPKLKTALRQLKDQPREMLNVLVWWASAHLDETDTIIDIASLATSLGFETLGARLRERNTNVIVSQDEDFPGHFILRCRSKIDIRKWMKRIVQAGDAVLLPREGRFKYGWRVADKCKDLVWTALGESFGDEWATVPGDKVLRIPPTNWRQVRSAWEVVYPRPNQRAAAPPTDIVRVFQDRVEVHTPSRNFAFVDALKAAISNWKERRWNRQCRCWTIAPQHEALVRRLVAQHFNGAR